MKDPNSNQTVLAAATTEMAVHKPIQRWSAARKRDVVLRLLRGERARSQSNRTGWSSGASAPWLDWTPDSRTAQRMTRCRPDWVPPTRPELTNRPSGTHSGTYIESIALMP
jgi:hypothetical protein